MSKLNTTEKKRRFILFCLLGIVIVVGIILASLMLFAPNRMPSESRMTSPKNDAIQGGANIDANASSEEYNRKLQEHDSQQASAALKAGESFVPTPAGQRKPPLQRKEDAPPSPPPVEQVRTAPVQAPRANQSSNEMKKRMLEDLAALDSKLTTVSVSTGNIAYIREAESLVPTEKTNTAAQSSTATLTTGLKAGDILYAIIDTGVNSDVPSAVMATVATGKYKDARLLGSFQRFEERLVLTFTRAILPDGQSFQLEAYAIDPKTTEASVASSVDTHFFSRWGGLVASAFLEGLADAKLYSGAESTVYGSSLTGDQMLWNTYSPADQAWIAAGKVGEKAGKIFESNFDRVPTVYLKSGSPVGVLILNIEAK